MWDGEFRFLALLGMTRGGARVMDSRLRGNDGRFCKGLHQGRGDSGGCFGSLLPCPVDTALKPV